MTKWIVTSILCLTTTLAMAADGTRIVYEEVGIPHKLHVGVDVFNRDVTSGDQAIGPPGTERPNEDGTMVGIHAGYDYVNPDMWYFGTDVRAASGDTSAARGDSANDILNVEVRLGQTLTLAEHLDHALSFFLGYGLHTWERDPDSLFSPGEDYEWQYIAAGVRGERVISDHLSVGFSAKVMYTLNGEVEVKLSETSPGTKDVTADLEDSLQVELELPLMYHLYTHIPIDIILTPYYRNLSLDGTDAATITRQDGTSSGTFTMGSLDIVEFGGRLEAVLRF